MVHVIALVISCTDWHSGRGVNDRHCSCVYDRHSGGVDDWYCCGHSSVMHGCWLIVNSWSHDLWLAISWVRDCRTNNSCLVISGVSDFSTNDNWLVVGDVSADSVLTSLVVVLWMGVDGLVVDLGRVDDRLIVVRDSLVLDWLVSSILVLNWLVVDMLVVDGLVVGVLVVDWLVGDGFPVLWLVCCGLVVFWLVSRVLVMHGLVGGVFVVVWNSVMLNSSVDFVMANAYGCNMTVDAQSSDVSISDWGSID